MLGGQNYERILYCIFTLFFYLLRMRMDKKWEKITIFYLHYYYNMVI